ncbi:hypothetical protein [Taibaiella koreensis]|uniref:hypothetical protein n=1 Tax=Taibaiella koreensis TaxID=1268548 RepID=UPI000E5A0B6A|nr:hypothetical protein [Taibaiella koreensis]
MAKGNYIVSATEERNDIVFSPAPDAEDPIPSDQQDLMFQVGSVLEVVKQLYQQNDQASFSNYFNQLLSLAQVGLVGANSQPALALRALEQIKAEIVNRESGKKKNGYLRKLGKLALLAGLPPLLIGCCFNYFICRDDNSLPGCLNFSYAAALLVLWSGCMMGVWLSFAITRTVLSFDELVIIEKDRLEPGLRLIFTGLLSLVFGLLFIRKAIVVSLGDISSVNMAKDCLTAFIMGVLLGLNEKIIGNSLTRKTSGIFDK